MKSHVSIVVATLLLFQPTYPMGKGKKKEQPSALKMTLAQFQKSTDTKKESETPTTTPQEIPSDLFVKSTEKASTPKPAEESLLVLTCHNKPADQQVAVEEVETTDLKPLIECEEKKEKIKYQVADEEIGKTVKDPITSEAYQQAIKISKPLVKKLVVEKVDHGNDFESYYLGRKKNNNYIKTTSQATMSALNRMKNNASKDDKRAMTYQIEQSELQIRTELKAIADQYPGNDLVSLHLRIEAESKYIQDLNYIRKRAAQLGVEVINDVSDMMIKHSVEHINLRAKRSALTKVADRQGMQFAKQLAKETQSKKTADTDLEDGYISEEDYEDFEGLDRKVNGTVLVQKERYNKVVREIG